MRPPCLLAQSTTTVLTASRTPASGGTACNFTLIATVEADQSTPTGMVKFYANSDSLGSQPLNINGVASISLPGLSGRQEFTAVYTGNADYTASTSAPFTFDSSGEDPTFTVTNTNDTGTGSLRWAVSQADAAGAVSTITFDSTVFSATQTITLTSGSLVLSDSAPMSIQGPGAGLLSISSNGTDRLFIQRSKRCSGFSERIDND